MDLLNVNLNLERMFIYQRIIQGICIIGLVVILIGSIIIEKEQFIFAFLMYSLLSLIPIGALQLLGSVYFQYKYGRHSKLRMHLKLSLFALSGFGLGLLVGALFHSPVAGILISASMLMSIGLMIYFWTIVFQKQVSEIYD